MEPTGEIVVVLMVVEEPPDKMVIVTSPALNPVTFSEKVARHITELAFVV